MGRQKNDIPLVANTSDIMVRHYIFNLACDFKSKCFCGSVILYLKPVEKCHEPNSMQCRCDGSELDYIDTKVIESEVHRSTPPCKETGHASTSCKLQGKKEAEYLDIHPTLPVIVNGFDSTTLFPMKESSKISLSEFKCILDSHEIEIKDVHEIIIDPKTFAEKMYTPDSFMYQYKSSLNFCVSEWSLEIWKEGKFCPFCFPRIIKIDYVTKPEGSSLIWVKDQEGNPAVFTYGAWINNRSLFPCQEPPFAMATWTATVSVPEPYVVVMSGDAEPIISHDNGIIHYFFYTKTILPIATLSLAVGFWKGKLISDSSSILSSVTQGSTSRVAIRMFATPSLLSKAIEELSEYILKCIKAAEFYLGPYPYPRIDFLIVPRGFGSLGMASPNVIFLSQTVIAGDKSMCLRVAHEISHAWFGLLIGALDWTEEWLSEGFATFMEDIIHLKTIGMTESEAEDFLEVRSYIRLRILLAEALVVDPKLQILRPNQGEDVKAVVDGTNAIILINAQKPEKGFLQVHYIKGFFILKYLSQLVGLNNFIRLLKSYITKYSGQLVGSKEIFEMYVETFPSVRDKGITVDSLISKWLHSPDIAEEIRAMKPSSTNMLYETAILQAVKWKTVNSLILSRKPSKKRKKYSFDDFLSLTTEQVIIVLEELLEENKLSLTLMKHLDRTYNLSNTNAEIRHRWCELIVKHRYSVGYCCLKKFLKEDLAMGVYLYAELLITGVPSHRAIVEDCFKMLMSEMEPNYVVIIRQMLEGIDDTDGD